MPASSRSAAPVDVAAPAQARLFFALWPGPALAATLAHWAAQAQAACGGRAMRPDTLHLTLAFLGARSEEHTSELQSLMRISYAVFCLKKKKNHCKTK